MLSRPAPPRPALQSGVCLCGSVSCRGSFLYLVDHAEPALQQVGGWVGGVDGWVDRVGGRVGGVWAGLV